MILQLIRLGILQKGMNVNQQLQRQRKAKIKAETNAFTCLLVYFVVKAIVILILYKYDNLLKHQPLYAIPFAALLLANTHLMLTTGKDPGFETSPSIDQNQLLNYSRTKDNYCQLCNCRRKNRSKHCYQCGRCVRKYDHHCPWIGACVGEKNHCKFWLLLLTHTLQASLTFYILFASTSYYSYELADGSYSQQYGVFCIFSFFMMLYVAFAGGLLGFHTYLLGTNITTRELVKRSKCNYLSKVRSNPYSQGLIHNFRTAIYVEESGRQWLVQLEEQQSKKTKAWYEKIWANDYYSCC